MGGSFLNLLLMHCALLIAQTDRQPLIAAGEDAVTFVLSDEQGRVPRLILFDNPEQRLTAASINLLRGTSNVVPSGVAVDFRALRFLRSAADPSQVIVRLVGIKNEFELATPLSLRELESGKSITVHFGPATIGAGFVSGTTDAELVLEYHAADRTVRILKAGGQFTWAPILQEPEQDTGTLKDLKGVVGSVPSVGAVLKADPDAKQR
jgi:hypothetical protein